MKKIIKFLPILFVAILNAQANFDCGKFLSRQIDVEMNNPVQFQEDFLNFRHCGLDDYDIEMLSSNANLAGLLIGLIAEKSERKITYRMVLEKILTLTNTEQYQELRQSFIASKELENKIAKIENWNEDKGKLELMNPSTDMINEVHNFIVENSGMKTYKEIFLLLTKEEDVITDHFEFENYGDANLDDLLKQAANANRPLLIYFSGYGCVNSRKIENLLIQNGLTKTINEKFYLVCLYVDDKRELPKNEQFQSVFGEQIKTLGKKHSDFQIKKFGVSAQPYFAILNSKGDIIATEHYTSEVTTFKNFLAQAF